MPVNQRVILRQAVPGRPQASDFDLVEDAVPAPGAGQVLIRHAFLSIDPYMASAIKGRHMSGTIAPGDLMPGETVGHVVESRHPDYAVGDLVISRGGWQSYSVASAPVVGVQGMAAALSLAATKLDWPDDLSPSLALGVLGMPGLTGFAGMRDGLQPKPGETVVVSAASGAVGATAAQVARIMGARVVGIAGGPDKCTFVTQTLALDGCVDRHEADWSKRLAALCPDSVHAYFDTVGGDMLRGVMPSLALRARILLCGMMDQYNAGEVLPGPPLGPILARRARIEGFVVYDHWETMAAWRSLGAGWLRDGRLHAKEAVTHGLDTAPAAFAALMAGGNFGKTIVALAA